MESIEEILPFVFNKLSKIQFSHFQKKIKQDKELADLVWEVKLFCAENNISSESEYWEKRKKTHLLRDTITGSLESINIDEPLAPDLLSSELVEELWQESSILAYLFEPEKFDKKMLFNYLRKTDEEFNEEVEAIKFECKANSFKTAEEYVQTMNNLFPSWIKSMEKTMQINEEVHRGPAIQSPVKHFGRINWSLLVESYDKKNNRVLSIMFEKYWIVLRAAAYKILKNREDTLDILGEAMAYLTNKKTKRKSYFKDEKGEINVRKILLALVRDKANELKRNKK